MLSTYQLNPVNDPYREVGIHFTHSFSSFNFSALEIDIVCIDTNNDNNRITAANYKNSFKYIIFLTSEKISESDQNYCSACFSRVQNEYILALLAEIDFNIM